MVVPDAIAEALRAVDLGVWVTVISATPSIAAKFAGVVVDPHGRPPLGSLPTSHLLMNRVPECNCPLR